MKKAIGIMILVGASVAAVITPAMAERRDEGNFGYPYRTEQRAGYEGRRYDGDMRGARDNHRDEDRATETRLRDGRYHREHDEWRSRADRDRR